MFFLRDEMIVGLTLGCSIICASNRESALCSLLFFLLFWSLLFGFYCSIFSIVIIILLVLLLLLVMQLSFPTFLARNAKYTVILLCVLRKMDS